MSNAMVVVLDQRAAYLPSVEGSDLRDGMADRAEPGPQWRFGIYQVITPLQGAKR